MCIFQLRRIFQELERRLGSDFATTTFRIEIEKSIEQVNEIIERKKFDIEHCRDNEKVIEELLSDKVLEKGICKIITEMINPELIYIEQLGKLLDAKDDLEKSIHY